MSELRFIKSCNQVTKICFWVGFLEVLVCNVESMQLESSIARATEFERTPR